MLSREHSLGSIHSLVDSVYLQVLVTTHSPDLLNYLSLDDIAVMIREQNRVRWFRPSSRATVRKLLESVEGETLGDLHRSGELEAIG